MEAKNKPDELNITCMIIAFSFCVTNSCAWAHYLDILVRLHDFFDSSKWEVVQLKVLGHILNVVHLAHPEGLEEVQMSLLHGLLVRMGVLMVVLQRWRRMVHGWKQMELLLLLLVFGSRYLLRWDIGCSRRYLALMLGLISLITDLLIHGSMVRRICRATGM